MSAERIAEIQKQIFELTGELGQFLKQSQGTEVSDYRFAGGSGEVSLLELFAGRDTLLAIHNMGQGCRYCTLWSLLALAGMGAQDWTPQYTYWKRPEVLDDGGENVY